MANVDVAVTVAAPNKLDLFGTPSDTERKFSAIPYGIAVYESEFVITAKPINDTLSMSLKLDPLPKGFVYRVRDFVFNTKTDLNGYDLVGSIRYRPGDVRTEIVATGKAYVGTGQAPWLLFTAKNPLRKLLNPHIGEYFQINLSNQSDPAEAAGTAYFYITFEMFNYEQALRWAVNTAQPVVSISNQ